MPLYLKQIKLVQATTKKIYVGPSPIACVTAMYLTAMYVTALYVTAMYVTALYVTALNVTALKALTVRTA